MKLEKHPFSGLGLSELARTMLDSAPIDPNTSTQEFIKAQREINRLITRRAETIRDFSTPANIMLESADLSKPKSPLLWCLFMSFHFNFQRRVPSEEYNRLKAIAKDIHSVLNELEDSPDKHRIIADLDQGLAVLARDHGDFKTAMQAQSKTAIAYLALEDEESAAIADYLYQVEATNISLTEGMQNEIIVNEMVTAYHKAQEKIPKEHSWYPNLPLHLGLVLIWTKNLNNPYWTANCFDYIMGLTGKRAEQYAIWMRLFRLAEHIRLHENEQAKELAQDILIWEYIKKENNGDLALTTTLLIARITEGEEHSEALTLISSCTHTQLKDHVVIAIAANEFTTTS